MSKRWKKPLVFETVDVWPDVPIGMNILKNKFIINYLNKKVNQIYNHASLIVALSEGMKEQILSHNIPDDKILISWNGTNIDNFRFIERVDDEIINIVYTGTIGKANGCDFILKAAQKLQYNSRIRFLFLGDGNNKNELIKLKEKMNLNNVHFQDFIPKENMNEFMSKASIGLVTFAPFPVLEANSANKFYDYLASGLPVITNYLGWQSIYLKEFNCGLSSKQNDLDSFIKNIEILVFDNEKRKIMGQNGRTLAVNKFDRKNLANDLLEKFKNLK